jgi:hypothetical protein
MTRKRSRARSGSLAGAFGSSKLKKSNKSSTKIQPKRAGLSKKMVSALPELTVILVEILPHIPAGTSQADLCRQLEQHPLVRKNVKLRDYRATTFEFMIAELKRQGTMLETSKEPAGKRHSRELRAQLVADYEKLHSYSAVARLHGVSHSAVQRAVKKTRK